MRQNFVRREEVSFAIVQGMAPPEGSRECSQIPCPNTLLTEVIDTTKNITPLLQSLILPLASGTPEPANVTSTQLATMLFSHLLRSSPRAKGAARLIMPDPASAVADSSAFFVPADGAPPIEPPQEELEKDDPQSLLQIIAENLSLALLSRSRADTSDREIREWDRLVVSYMSLLSQWLWEDPKSVRDFLEAGGLSVVSQHDHLHVFKSLILTLISSSWLKPLTKPRKWIH